MNKNNKEKAIAIKNELCAYNPSLAGLEFIGGGNNGYAYQTGGLIVKVTGDIQEFTVAYALTQYNEQYPQGLISSCIASPHLVFSFYSKSQNRYYGVIFMEKLEMSSPLQLYIKLAVKDFIHVWISEFFNKNGMSGDYWMICDIYREGSKDVIQKTRNMLERFLALQHEEEYSTLEYKREIRVKFSLFFFDFISKLYKEILSIYPNARVDLNEGNFGFDSNKHLKAFDFQVYDEAQCHKDIFSILRKF